MAQSLRLGGSLLARVSSAACLRQGDPLPSQLLLEVCFETHNSGAHPDALPADLIQDMYLKELKAYKAPTPKPSDSDGQVKTFNPPQTPRSPEEANLASSMKEYEDQVVEVEGAVAAGETQQSVEEDYFEDLNQFDEEPVSH